MTERAKRCGTCGAYYGGQCRRRAAIAIGTAVTGSARLQDGYQHPLSGAWPLVERDDWCLDWVPREAGDGGE